MFVESISFFNFRNLENNTFNFCPGINFILGNNGQGKTNIIEGIDLLACGKSFRTSNLRDLISWNNNEASVYLKLNRNSGVSDLGIVIKNNTKEFFQDSNKLNKSSDILGKLLVITFSPSDILIVKAEPDLRRSFIDRHLCEIKPGIIPTLINYRKALKSKNILLKTESDYRKIYAWNEILAREGTLIRTARLEFIKQLQEKADALHQQYSEEDGKLNLSLKSNFLNDDFSSNLEFLNSEINSETMARKSIYGIHRDDLIITLDDKDARNFSSQGQARSIILSLKLAVIRLLEDCHNDTPLVLLDDVDAELDSTRGQNFFNLILSGKNQVFLTGTEQRRALVSQKNQTKSFTIEQGKLLDFAG